MSRFANGSVKNSLKEHIDAVLLQAINKTENPKSFVNGVGFGITNDKETVYSNQVGLSNEEKGQEFSSETLFNYWSTTKPIVSTAVLQLYERGLVDLDAAASTYLPILKDVKVIKGWDNDEPILKTPETEPTVKQLLLHTSGFAYAFYNEDYRKLLAKYGEPNIFNITEESLKCMPLVFEPGSQFLYGHGLDFAGFIVESVSGMTLEQYLKENIFKPAKMNDVTFEVQPKDSDKVLICDSRQSDGSLRPYSTQPLQTPAKHCGGHGLFGTIELYLRFIRIWINEGKADDGTQIIKKETWKEASQNNLPPNFTTTDFNSTDAELTKSVKSSDFWSLGFGITREDSKAGVPKDSLYWCGLANLFFWIDLKNKIGGYYVTQLFPHADPSIQAYPKLQKIAYDHLQ
ncbi:beta-lactamase/transpeptidase-like protein [Hyphopichia burtonii NRRL Y-1933]|uniref:Beta-lactamase/transpeptidase-like protein n=1 Tax=Hyphopichia burtonii NRRL Y-1933 TaxID=984485 RepID=A0A1E4RIP3_9ASCO|nr:beta-lactamase/transpeptidase-like protein [Hyphopichia burtonii NRRL Y-1933]ODV67106.1 beta-lactamase/transpeptidase-like protein [Hyphopichia burtonii NRRL Y-1933]